MRWSVVIGCLLAAASYTRALRADACSPCISHKVQLGGDSMTQPANAAFWVWNADPDEVAVLVDGMPAQFEVQPDLELDGYAGTKANALMLSEPPTVGTLVNVQSPPGHICFGEEGASVWNAEFITGTPDDQPPAGVTAPYWDLQTYEGVSYGCSVDDSGRLFLRGDVPHEGAQQAGRLADVEISYDQQLVLRDRTAVEGGSFDLGITLENGDFHDVELDDLCVRVTIADLAGHRSETSPWICGPCHRVHSVANRWGDPPPEPEWTADDLVEDGYCGFGDLPDPPPAPPPDPTGGSTSGTDTTTSTSGGDTGPAPTTSSTTAAPSTSLSTSDSDEPHMDDDGISPRGCACNSPGDGPSAYWLLAVFGALRRRVH